MYLSDIYTITANLAGIPGISIPCGLTRANLPIGLQLLAAPFAEEKLLRTARVFERATDWHLEAAGVGYNGGRSMDYEIIIGLEIHVQLQTESKMFSWSGTDFGLPPNTQTDPVSLGLPGTLPVMNRKAFDLASKTAVALHAEIAPFTKWDRKNYYYPDLPKNYQISQYDLPFSQGGHLEIPVRKDGGGGGRCRLTRIHLEEDTGKLTHGDGGFSEVDLNRAGIPLLEIVTEPEIRSPADARGCLEELRLTLRYLEVSDCEMQEGSLRCDANVNLHINKDGQTIATPIVEIKNLNSFRAVEKALIYEAERQYQQVARRRQDDQGRAQDDARLERRRRGHQAPAREGDGRRLSLFPRARPGSGGRRRSLAGSHPHVDRRAARAAPAAVRDRLRPLALRRQRPGRAGPGRRRLLRRRRQGHRRVQAGEQLDPAGRAPDHQGEEADRRRVSGPPRPARRPDQPRQGAAS